MPVSDAVIRVAAVGDIHFPRDTRDQLQPLFAAVNEQADLLLLAGDLTDYGTLDDARGLARELGLLRVPVVGVLGNHDCEAGHAREVSQILRDAGVHMLDGEAVEVCGVGIAGVKGFAGGFGRGTLGAWGEAAVKAFVQEALDEALKLEAALARLRTPRKVALMHYAPVEATVVGEPEVIYPFLGTSRLEEPLLRYPVDAVVHGHAHNGTPEGQTQRGVPVYNVSYSLLKKHYPDRPGFRLLELAREAEPAA